MKCIYLQDIFDLKHYSNKITTFTKLLYNVYGSCIIVFIYLLMVISDQNML
jgi:hypothetical protein